MSAAMECDRLTSVRLNAFCLNSRSLERWNTGDTITGALLTVYSLMGFCFGTQRRRLESVRPGRNDAQGADRGARDLHKESVEYGRAS